MYRLVTDCNAGSIIAVRGLMVVYDMAVADVIRTMSWLVLRCAEPDNMVMSQ